MTFNLPTEFVRYLFDIWKLSYFFEKDGEQVDALPDDLVPFYAKVNGFNIGISKLLADGWTLQNEVGVELDLEQAQKIRALMKDHFEK